MRLASLTLVLGTVALLGLGCKSPQEKLEQRIQAAKEQAVATFGLHEAAPAEEPAEPRRDGLEGPDPSSEIIYLRQVMRNLGRAETFRAVIDVPVQDGDADISVDYNKAVGLYGRMRIDVDNRLTISDIFLSEDEIHFRMNTDAWTNITDSDEATVLRTLFQNITQPNQKAEEFVSKYAQMQERAEQPNCTLYAFKQYNATRARVELYQVCVKGDLPVYVITDAPFGKQRIVYKDINNFVDVQHP